MKTDREKRKCDGCENPPDDRRWFDQFRGESHCADCAGITEQEKALLTYEDGLRDAADQIAALESENARLKKNYRQQNRLWRESMEQCNELKKVAQKVDKYLTTRIVDYDVEIDSTDSEMVLGALAELKHIKQYVTTVLGLGRLAK